MRIVRAFFAAASLLGAAFGCGLIDNSFTVSTDPQTFTLDSAMLGLNLQGATIPAVPCQQDTDCTAGATAITCGGTNFTCALQCGGGTCEISGTVEQSFTIDLSQQIKSSLAAKAVSKVTLEKFFYKVLESSLTFDTPSIELSVGPHDAASASAATLFATLPSIAKGSAPGEAQLVQVTAAGQSALEGYVLNYAAPFRIFAAASPRLVSGDPVPQGRVKVEIRAYFKIDPT